MALRFILPPLLLLLVLTSATPLSGATERDRKRSRATHAGLKLVASKRRAILTGRNLAPGDRVAGSLTVTNTGTLAGSFTLSGKVHGSRPMANHLVLTVRESRRGRLRVVYSGRLARFRTVKLGLIRGGQARRFRFAVVFSSSAPNALQGKRTTASFTWRAVQAP